MRRDAAGRLAGEQDAHGTALSALEWRSDGRLQHARVRLPDGSWIAIEPGAGAPGPWGASDLVTRDGQALSRLAALDWTRVDRIPPLAEPARLPAGAGTAIFNLLALLESFRYVPAQAPDPSGAFAVGALAWTPAPHEVAVEAGGVWVQQRERIEKIVLGGRTYYRPDWQGVRRRAPRVVRDVGDTVRASLSVLGRVLEDHVVLAADGRVLETPPAAPDSPNVTPLAPEVIAGVIATVVATSAPALAPWIAVAARDVAFERGPVEADLVEARDTRVRLSHRLTRALSDAVRDRPRADALAIGLVALREIADLVGDHLRARAQTLLAAQPPSVQANALEESAPMADAHAIAAAADALTREAAPA